MSIEKVLLNRVKVVGDGEWTLLGMPSDVIKELNGVLDTQKKAFAEYVIGEPILLTNYYNEEIKEYDVDGTVEGGSWGDIFEAGSQQTINEQRERAGLSK